MKVFIVEDEELAVKKLRKTLESVDNTAEVVGVAESIRASVNWLQNNPTPDLILMDIELCDGQSFEIFDKVDVNLGGNTFTILKKNSGQKITAITYDNQKVDGYFVAHHELIKGKKLVITTN